MVCRYTGEDGFELSIPSSQVLQVAETLVADDRVRMTGLGARDSLRLEAGLCLYGAILDCLRVRGGGSTSVNVPYPRYTELMAPSGPCMRGYSGHLLDQAAS